MASLWDKLTGKAPFNETPSEDAKGADVDTSKKDDIKIEDDVERQSAINDLIDKKIRNNKDLKIVGKWFLPVVLCGCLIILANFVMGQINNPRREKIASQDYEIQTLNNEIDRLQNQLNSITTQEKRKVETINSTDDIYNNETQIAHDELVSDIIRHYSTWNTGLEYNTLFEEASNDESLKESAQFISTFFPKQETYFDTETGRTYYEIDERQLNSKFESFESYMLQRSKANGTSTYAGIATLSYVNYTNLGAKTLYNKVYVVYTVTSSNTVVFDRVVMLAD